MPLSTLIPRLLGTLLVCLFTVLPGLALAQAPAVALTHPAPGTLVTLPAVVYLEASASSPDSTIDRVDFLINGTLLQQRTQAPYSALWNPASPGVYSLTARATDHQGRQTATAPLSITVHPRGSSGTPRVTITNPADGTAFIGSDQTTITATAGGDDLTVASVQFLVDGHLLETDGTTPYSALWNYTAGTEGPRAYKLTALATSTAGTSALSPEISVIVMPLTDPGLTRLPYLQMGTSTAITIRWRTTIPHRGRVRFGKVPGMPTLSANEASAQSEHEIRLTGLQPNTRYYYSVGTSDVANAGGDAETYFTTPPPTGRAKSTRIWTFGDTGFGTPEQKATRDAYYAFTGKRDTDILLLLGDNAYYSGLDYEYQANFFDIYEPLLRKVHTWPALGNHETGQSAVHNPSFAYYQIFSLPTAAECGGTPSGTEQFYSFDYSNIHFICLDSMTSIRTNDGAMATWLEADVAATNARWIIAYWHHPPYTRAGYNSDDPFFPGTDMRANLLPILEANGVDLVLAGHDHTYERSWFITGHYGTSTSFNPMMKRQSGLGQPGVGGAYIKNVNATESNRGTVYAVVACGATIYPGPFPHPALAVGKAELGSGVIDVSGNHLTFSFLTSTGVVDDTFTIIKPYGSTDSDGDGMPDDYETEYGLDPHNSADGPQDADGDGSSNHDEFLAGTDPQDSSSCLLTTVQPGANGYLIRFKTTAGYTYTVQRRDSLTTGDWNDLATNLPGTGQERTVSDTTPGPAGKRFYRLRVQPQ